MRIFNTFNDYKQSIFQFLREHNVAIDPVPRIIFNREPVDMFDPLIKTGAYNKINNTIILHIDKRHLKDILRSLFHELIHHSQYLYESSQLNQKTKDITDPHLRPIEYEAYAKGNVLFREWTDQFKN